MRYLILLFLLVVLGCEPIFHKPFLVVSKWIEHDDKYAQYVIQDSNGQHCLIKEECSKYDIGDTIK